MKELVNGKIYNTETASLLKFVVLPEELGDGYVRYKTIQLYYTSRGDAWFLAINKTTVDRCMMVIDVIEYIKPVEEEFVYKFRDNVKDIL